MKLYHILFGTCIAIVTGFALYAIPFISVLPSYILEKL